MLSFYRPVLSASFYRPGFFLMIHLICSASFQYLNLKQNTCIKMASPQKIDSSSNDSAVKPNIYHLLLLFLCLNQVKTWISTFKIKCIGYAYKRTF
ncbi:hypothetical protein AQ505_11135 [Pedobacter sp. PACM 27299]|nr:hypothetical protein AQ505_11135 [Pedobacter sp. PACM 27299]